MRSAACHEDIHGCAGVGVWKIVAALFFRVSLSLRQHNFDTYDTSSEALELRFKYPSSLSRGSHISNVMSAAEARLIGGI